MHFTFGRNRGRLRWSAYDFFPTILEIANLPFEEGNLPGKSFAGVWYGEDEKKRDDVVVFDEYGTVRMLRQKDYKYVCRYPHGPNELYDLVNDPQELHNIIDKASPELVRLLHNRLESWFFFQTRPETDGRTAGVTGGGQKRKHTSYGFEPDSFEAGY